MEDETKLSEDDLRQLGQMRKVAFVATAVSTAAVLACVIGMPMLYDAMLQVQSGVDDQLANCRVCFN